MVGEWAHFAGTWDGTTIRIYKNGQFVNDLVHPAPGGVGFFSDLIIGLWPDAGGFAGTIDEVRIWNTVRSDAQIDYWKNKPISGSEPDLLGYWRLNEGSGQVIADSSLLENGGILGSTASMDPDDPVWTSEGAPIYGLFYDNFETGGTSAWSTVVP